VLALAPSITFTNRVTPLRARLHGIQAVWRRCSSLRAAIAGLIGLAVFISAYTRFPLVRVLLFSPAVMHVERIQENLDQRGNRSAFDGRLKIATWMLGGSFLFSAAMNYLLATWIVTSPTGSPAFNEELVRLTLLSYPMIALPSLLIMIAALYYLARSIRELAGMQLAEVLRH